MTHCRSPSLNPSAASIDGSATFTTVMSRMTMNCATHSRISVVQGLRSSASVAAD
jgi:hypothetical protein